MKKILFLLLAVVMFATACEDLEGFGGDVSSPQIELSQLRMEVDCNSAEHSVYVSAPCSWEAESMVEWITIETKSANKSDKDVKLLFYVEDNMDIASRVGKILISNDELKLYATLIITQNGFEPVLKCEPKSLAFPFKGGAEKLKITATVSYQLSATADWISMRDDDGEVLVTVAPSELVTERTAEIVVFNEKYDLETKIAVLQRALNYGENNTLYYTTSDGQTVTPYDATAFDANIVLNSYENGRGMIVFDGSLTTIKYSAFYNCSTLTSVELPSELIEVGESAFEGCTSLESIKIPSKVRTMRSNAFRDCKSLGRVDILDLLAWCRVNFTTNSNGNPLTYGAGLYINGEELTDLVIPSDIKRLNFAAFFGCGSIRSVTFHDDVTEIGKSAFNGCVNITSVTMGSGITSIRDYAFCRCEGLSNIAIPDSVTSIGISAFKYCSSLTSITIPDSVTSIGDSAFYDCRSLTSVTIGNGVTSIGEYAFGYCTNLESVTIGRGVTSIGKGGFGDCEKIARVDISDLSAWCKIEFGSGMAANPLRYGAELYLNGSKLTDLVIPSDITEIKSYAFCFCPSITSVTIPDSVTSLGKYAFYNCNNMQSATIGNGVTEIGEYAFYKCNNMQSVTIGNGVTEIGNYTFSQCSSLTSITIPDSVTSIGDSAFYNCFSLKSVTIPESVTSVGSSIFGSCNGLEYFYGKFASEDNCCLIIDGTLNSYAAGSTLTTYTIPEGVTAIGTNAFTDSDRLKMVTIPDGVKSLSNRAFYHCSSLRNVYCKHITPPTGGSEMFDETSSSLKIYVPNESVDKYKADEIWNNYTIVGYDF